MKKQMLLLLLMCTLASASSGQGGFIVSWTSDAANDCVIDIKPNTTVGSSTSIPPGKLPSNVPVYITTSLKNASFQKLIINGIEFTDASNFCNTSNCPKLSFSIGADGMLKATGATPLLDKGPIQYPYTVRLETSKDTCTIKLGDETNIPSIPRPSIDILAGMTPPNASLSGNFDSLGDYNAVVLIDSPKSMAGPSSAIYRKDKNGNLKKVNHLRKGDWVYVCLNRFNHYQYEQIKVDGKLVDIDYSQRPDFSNFQPSQDNGNNTEIAATENQSRSSQEAALLHQYAQASAQLSLFIESVQSNDNPDAEWLAENKRTIFGNLQNEGLINEEGQMTEDLLELYRSWGDSTKEAKELYEAAAKFPKNLATFRSLHYSIIASHLPYKVGNQDRFAIRVELEKKSAQASVSRDYQIPIRGGIKINQTFGLVAHKIFDEEYALREVVIDDNGNELSKYQLIEDPSPTQLSIGLSTITHFYWQMGPINFGPTVGVAADIGSNTRLRYLAGGSILFGNGRHRVSLDMGVAYGQFQALSGSQQVGDVFDTPDPEQIKLVDKGKTSFYWGLSYNIPINNQQNSAGGN